MTAQKVIFEKKNVLVVGGAGFIGSHLCDELVKSAKVICVDNYSSGSVNNIAHLLQNPNFIFLRHDISQPLDFAAFPELELFEVKFQGVQEIYYLACPSIKLGFEDYAIATARANSVGVFTTLELARQYEAKFLLTSTHSIYGELLKGQTSFREEYWGFIDPLADRACYNEGKRFAETVTMVYHRTFGLNTKIARIFNTYGPRMRLNSGRQIPDFVRAAIDKQDLVIHGDGTAVDSYCYVSDIVQGLCALMRATIHDPINLGNPDTYRIIDIAKKVIQQVGAKSSMVFTNEIAGLHRPGVPDISRARQILGWFPVTEIEIGLQKTIDDMLGSRVLTYQPK